MQSPCKENTLHKSIFTCTVHKRLQRLRCVGVSGSLYVIIAVFLFFASLVFFSTKTTFWQRCTYRHSGSAKSDHAIPEIKFVPNDTIPTNLAHIMFGLSGSTDTWDMWRPYNELWWRQGEMKGYVWLDKKPTSTSSWPDTCTPYKISKSYTPIARIARIVVDTYQSMLSDPGLTNIRWFVMGDDDTVFFPENLVAVLRKYDHEQMYYIGSISESAEQDLEHSFNMAFGGAGFAISSPAVAVLARIMEGCLERYARLQASDYLIQSCLSELGVPLTHEPGFHQTDLKGSIYGILAAHPITPLVSLHNFNHIELISSHYETQYEAIKSIVDISKFDPSRTLQQSICYEREPGLSWSVSVSWGYTVELYPWFVSPVDLARALMTFQTWRTQSRGPFTIDTKVRSTWLCDQPLIFSFERAKVEESQNGTNFTVTEYSKRGLNLKNLNPDEQKCESPFFTEASKIKTVRVIAPKMDSNEWKLAPRRQCCKTARIDQGETLTVRISRCQHGQSLISH